MSIKIRKDAYYLGEIDKAALIKQSLPPLLLFPAIRKSSSEMVMTVVFSNPGDAPPSGLLRAGENLFRFPPAMRLIKDSKVF